MTVVHDWNHVDSHCVNGCVHHSWPHFQGRDFEECHHRVEDVIVVVDWDYPFSLLTFPSDFHAISIYYIHLEPPMALAPIYDHCAIWQFMIITVSKFTHEQLNSKNTEDHEEEEHNKQDIKKGWNREEKTIDHCLDSLVLGNHSQGSQGSQGSETSDETNVCTSCGLHDPCKNTEHNNDEIKNVPVVLKIGLLSNIESYNNNLDAHFDHKNNRDDEKQVGNSLLLVWVTQLGLIQGQQ